MEYELRPVTDEEWPAYVRAVELGFISHPDDDDIANWRTTVELDRTLAAFEGDRIIGNAGAFTLEVTAPGPVTVPMAGVTAVGVRTTHRRQGVLTAMMRAQLDDVRDRGEAVAGLYASESVIYGRFGYGLASSQVEVEVDTDWGTFRDPAPDGRLDILDAEAAAKVLPDIHDRARRQQPGDVNRTPAWWDLFFKDREKEREGGSARFYVVHESSPGQADGYAAYRAKHKWSDGLPGGEVRIVDMATTSDAAYANLWRHLLDVDLVARVTAWKRPVDEPLRWLLTDPRRMKVKALTDELWVRLVDISRALPARRYGIDERLVFEVSEGFLAGDAGCYLLEANPHGAQCTRTDAAPDLALSVAELGSIWMGGVVPSNLARAGRVREKSPGALARADRLFATSPAPYCRTMF
jgi:predicted acetyltransferase